MERLMKELMMAKMPTGFFLSSIPTAQMRKIENKRESCGMKSRLTRKRAIGALHIVNDIKHVHYYLFETKHSILMGDMTQKNKIPV